jgi:hypothetical protein
MKVKETFVLPGDLCVLLVEDNTHMRTLLRTLLKAMGMKRIVEYTDGAPTTVEQYAKDISAFLMWTAEPHLEARKRTGMQVFIFLIVLSLLLYFTKKKVWHEVKLHPEELKPRPPSEYPRA